jgi:hypothetical protein
MPLQPIRFKNAQDVDNFINKLAADNKIRITVVDGTKKIHFNPPVQGENHPFLRATDGSIYCD